jgi:hypothetical protein
LEPTGLSVYALGLRRSGWPRSWINGKSVAQRFVKTDGHGDRVSGVRISKSDAFGDKVMRGKVVRTDAFGDKTTRLFKVVRHPGI